MCEALQKILDAIANSARVPQWKSGSDSVFTIVGYPTATVSTLRSAQTNKQVLICQKNNHPKPENRQTSREAVVRMKVEGLENR